MAVLVVAEVRGQNQAGYDAMAELLTTRLQQAPGFVLHGAHPVDGGWRIVEVWRDKESADRFFATQVAANLPPDIRPKRSVQPLHNLVIAPAS
jgi:hypothetical protein